MSVNPEDPFMSDYLIREIIPVDEFHEGVQVVEIETSDTPAEAPRRMRPLLNGLVVLVPFEQQAIEPEQPKEVRDEEATLLLDAKGVVQFYGPGV